MKPESRRPGEGTGPYSAPGSEQAAAAGVVRKKGEDSGMQRKLEFHLKWDLTAALALSGDDRAQQQISGHAMRSPC